MKNVLSIWLIDLFVSSVYKTMFISNRIIKHVVYLVMFNCCLMPIKHTPSVVYKCQGTGQQKLNSISDVKKQNEEEGYRK